MPRPGRVRIYWFHPLVWMAWRRLRLEAEKACDDAVLREAGPEAYADQLVTLARLHRKGESRCSRWPIAAISLHVW